MKEKKDAKSPRESFLQVPWVQVIARIPWLSTLRWGMILLLMGWLLFLSQPSSSSFSLSTPSQSPATTRLWSSSSSPSLRLSHCYGDFQGKTPSWPFDRYRIHQGDPSMSSWNAENVIQDSPGWSINVKKGQGVQVCPGSDVWVKYLSGGKSLGGTGAREWGKDVRDRNKSQNETPVNKGLLRALTSVCPRAATLVSDTVASTAMLHHRDTNKHRKKNSTDSASFTHRVVTLFLSSPTKTSSSSSSPSPALSLC